MTEVAREATPDDNQPLVELSVACPMEGDIGLAVDRAPDFFALNRLEGPTWRVGVVDGPDGRPVGCIAVAARDVYLNGGARPVRLPAMEEAGTADEDALSALPPVEGTADFPTQEQESAAQQVVATRWNQEISG